MTKPKPPVVKFEEIPAKNAREGAIARWKTKGGRLDVRSGPRAFSATVVRARGGSLRMNLETGAFTWDKCDDEQKVEEIAALALTLLPHMVLDEAFTRRDWMAEAARFETSYEHEARQSSNADVAALAGWALRARAVGIAEIRGRHAWREWVHAIRGDLVLYTDQHGIIIVGPRGSDVSKRTRQFTLADGSWGGYLTSDMIARPIKIGEVDPSMLRKEGVPAHAVLKLVQESTALEEKFGPFPRDSKGWLKGIDLSAV